jgi:hypothetical protein
LFFGKLIIKGFENNKERKGKQITKQKLRLIYKKNNFQKFYQP